VEFFCNLKKKELEMFEDINLLNEAEVYREDVEYEWKEV
jgi:hypothetical protein